MGADVNVRPPVLAIVHDDRSVSPMQLAESAAGLCDVVWVVDSGQLNEPSMLRLLSKLGTTLDIAGMSEDDAAQALRPSTPAGIFAHSDRTIPLASALAGRLGLEYHDGVVSRCLVDKLSQRQALRDGGLPVPRCVSVPLHRTPDTVDALMAAVDFPVVLKPRRGTGSRDTVLVGDAAHLRALLDAMPRSADGGGPAMVVEEYLVGAPPPSPHVADYVSVESVVTGGDVSHVAVAGHFPPAEPFRETGMFVPSALARPAVEEVLDAAMQAIAALGVRIGFVHTEIKLTPGGPRIIEVNGRLGGYVPQIVALASDVDLFEQALRVALGQRVHVGGSLRTDRVGYHLLKAAPRWARRVTGVDGLGPLGDHPGVKTVFLNRRPGDDLDWREGSSGYVFSVLGAAPDHQGVEEVKRLVDDVRVTYS